MTAANSPLANFHFRGITNLGYATEFFFVHRLGEITERDDYWVAQSPANPDHMWGNFLLFKRAPTHSSLREWRSAYRREFPNNSWFCTLGWEAGKISAEVLAEFEVEGFCLEQADLLVASQVHPPVGINTDLAVRQLELNEIDRALHNHIRFLCHGEFALEQKKFEVQRFENYRELQRRNVGAWYGAFIGETLVGDMGIFAEQQIGRYQEVLTHFDYRRQGVCRTLAYQASRLAAKKFGIRAFVTLASEPEAKSAYRSIGFQLQGETFGLRWYDPMLRTPHSINDKKL